MQKKIIGLAALPGAGKTTTANILRDDFNFKIISVSDMLREKARDAGKNPDDREVLRSIRADLGDEDIAKWTVDQIKNSEGERFAIDAIRQVALDDALRTEFGESDYKVLAIHANHNERFQSHVSSGREREGSRISFIQTDLIELGYMRDGERGKYDTNEIFRRAKERGFEVNNDERNPDKLKATIGEVMQQMLTD